MSKIQKFVFFFGAVFLLPLHLFAASCDCNCESCPCLGEIYHDFRQVPVLVEDLGLCKDRVLLSLAVDAIYWYPLISPQTTLSYLIATNTSVYHQPDYDMRWGFKIAGSLFFDQIKSDLQAKYLWFYNKQDRGKFNLITLDTTLNSNNEIGYAVANYFNQFSVGLHRSFCAGEFFDIKGRGGLFAGWDQQWYDYKTVSSTTTIQYDQSQKWWGIGLQAGTELDFLIPFPFPNKRWGLDFFFDIGGALPYGKTKSLYTVTVTPTGSLDLDDFSAELWTMGLMFDMSIGLRYEGIIGCCDSGTKLSLNVAWDSQYWPNHIFGVPSVFRTYDYQMQGLTFGAKVSY